MQSYRLRKMIGLIPDGVGVVDIGTDHAQIPIELAKNSNCHPIIAGEKNRGPYHTARYWIDQAGLDSEIDLRQGSGLTILEAQEVQWAVIAGMGCKTIMEILQESEQIAHSLEGLILQPMQGPEILRQWIVENSFRIIDELLVKEDDKLFQIIVVQPGQMEEMDKIFYEVGPLLFKKADPLLGEHIESLIGYYEEVLEKIPPIRENRVKFRQWEIEKKMERLKEVLAQWQKKFNE